MSGAKPPQRPNKSGLPRRAFHPIEIADQLGLGYETVMRLIRSGELGSIKAGRYYLVPDFEFERYLREAA